MFDLRLLGAIAGLVTLVFGLVPCPLRNCSSQHEVREARNKAHSRYLTCDTWGASTIWIRSPIAEAWVANGGSPPRGGENPERTIESSGPEVRDERVVDDSAPENPHDELTHAEFLKLSQQLESLRQEADTWQRKRRGR